MGVRSRSSRSSKRRRLTATPGGDAGDDLISGLNDDLLLRILELLPDARDVVRTDAISRRWRGLWTGVAALRFDSDYRAGSSSAAGPRFRRRRRRRRSRAALCRFDAAGAAQRYLDFVNHALALRASSRARANRYAAVRDLTISFDVSQHKTPELVAPSLAAAQGWIRYAAENEVRSLLVDLDMPWDHAELPTKMGIVVELASSAKLETMDLTLGDARLRLPCSSSSSSPSSGVLFASLTDLSLRYIKVAGALLSRLVSSPCCPSLRKLHLFDAELLAPDEELLLEVEAGALSELSVEAMDSMRCLRLRTPSLEVLRVTDCMELERFEVASAPRLEDLTFWAQQPLHIDDVHGHLSSVQTLKIELLSDAYYIDDADDDNDGTFHILQSCSSARCLEAEIHVEETKHQIVDIIKGRLPPLPHVTSLTLDVTPREPHLYGSTITSFLAQCSNIRYLSLRLCYWTKKDELSGQDLLCGNSCLWKSPKLSLAHLQEVEFKNLIGTDCELQFIRSILKREVGVQRAAISFNPRYWRKDNKNASKLMPPLDGESWTMCNDDNLSYKWRRYCI